MLKQKYSMSQGGCCASPGNFIFRQRTIENETQSGIPSDLEVGSFTQAQGCTLKCCSCAPITQLRLEMYGQQLSIAKTQSKCCLMWGSQQQLIVKANEVVLLGKIRKIWNSMSVFNLIGQLVFKIIPSDSIFFWLIPRMLRCGSSLNYQIVNGAGKSVGKIRNAAGSPLESFCGLKDEFTVQFGKELMEKDKILLLNGVAFLNQMKHQFC